MAMEFEHFRQAETGCRKESEASWPNGAAGPSEEAAAGASERRPHRESREGAGALLRSAKSLDAAAAALALLARAETPEEKEACLKLLEVDRTPSPAAAAAGVWAWLWGDASALGAVFPGRRGPRLPVDSEPDARKAVEVLVLAARALSGALVGEELAISRAAVCLWSRDGAGLAASHTALSKMMAYAFPQDLGLTPYIMRGGKGGTDYCLNGTAPAPPAGLDARERVLFRRMVRELFAQDEVGTLVRLPMT